MFLYCVTAPMASVRTERQLRDALKTAFDSNGAVLLMFHSPRCGYCRDAMPPFEEAARLHSRPDRAYVTIDTTDTELKRLVAPIRGVPAFYTLNCDRGEYIVQDAAPERTVEGYKALLENVR